MHAHTKTHVGGNTSWIITTHTNAHARFSALECCPLVFCNVIHVSTNCCIEVMRLWLTLSAVVGLMSETRSYCRRSRAHSAWRRPCEEMRNIEGSVWFPLLAFCQSYQTWDIKPSFIEWLKLKIMKRRPLRDGILVTGSDSPWSEYTIWIHGDYMWVVVILAFWSWAPLPLLVSTPLHS